MAKRLMGRPRRRKQHGQRASTAGTARQPCKVQGYPWGVVWWSHVQVHGYNVHPGPIFVQSVVLVRARVLTQQLPHWIGGWRPPTCFPDNLLDIKQACSSRVTLKPYPLPWHLLPLSPTPADLAHLLHSMPGSTWAQGWAVARDSRAQRKNPGIVLPLFALRLPC